MVAVPLLMIRCILKYSQQPYINIFVLTLRRCFLIKHFAYLNVFRQLKNKVEVENDYSRD
jgi:hypothetical protein